MTRLMALVIMIVGSMLMIMIWLVDLGFPLEGSAASAALLGLAIAEIAARLLPPPEQG